MGAVIHAIAAACVVAGMLAPGAGAEQASQPASAAAGSLDAGGLHSCSLDLGRVRCWGFGGAGRLGYAGTATIGDDEVPSSAGPVDFGADRTPTAVSAGDFHSCALLDGGRVRCWGFGGNGRLGYGNENDIGDDETPGSAGDVDLGAGAAAKAISAGGSHTCAVLTDGRLRCWGFATDGALGFGGSSINHVGDNESPGSIAAVPFASGRTATAVSAGTHHTCALLDDATVRCFGEGSNGRLGYLNRGHRATAFSLGPVDLGSGHSAIAISAGGAHTCALLEDATVRCWGYGGNGRLGYASQRNIGDDETPGSAGPVNFGAHTARAISAGEDHTCALLDDGSVRCWGLGADGRLGYASQRNIGDDETPAAAGPVDLGPGRRAVAISAGARHTCARLDDGSVRCWGLGANGRLGYCSEDTIGDGETPGAAGPVDLGGPLGGAACAGLPSGAVSPQPADLGSPSPPAAASPALPAVPAAGATPFKRVAARLVVSVMPRRDRAFPYRYTVRGRLVLPPTVSRSQACAAGTGVVQSKAFKHATISTRRGRLSRSCTFRIRVTFSIPRRLGRRPAMIKMTGRFTGNAFLFPATAKPLFVRAG